MCVNRLWIQAKLMKYCNQAIMFGLARRMSLGADEVDQDKSSLED
jgi:hypothetical protein